MPITTAKELCIACGEVTEHIAERGVGCTQFRCCRCERINDWDFDDDAEYLPE
jgi:hypothetical protein